MGAEGETTTWRTLAGRFIGELTARKKGGGQTGG
jgi:hypothetical protein